MGSTMAITNKNRTAALAYFRTTRSLNFDASPPCNELLAEYPHLRMKRFPLIPAAIAFEGNGYARL
jgi:hypothetical protein